MNFSGRDGQGPVFGGVGCQFVQGHGQRQRLFGANRQIRPFDLEMPLPRPMRHQRGFDHFIDLCFGPGRLNKPVMRLRHHTDPRLNGSLGVLQAVCLSQRLRHDCMNHGQRVFHPVVHFRQHQLTLLFGDLDLVNIGAATIPANDFTC